MRLVDFIRELESKSKKSKKFRQKMLNNANKIELYENYINKHLYTDSFSDVVLENYLHFLKTLKPYRSSTIRSFGYKLKEYVKRASIVGYKIDSSCFDVEMPGDDYEGIALSTQEVYELFRLKNLTDAQNKVREWFVFNCCCGLRYSDLRVVSGMKLSKDYIKVTTTKTKTPVIVPLHCLIVELLKRNNNKMPDFSTIQNYNKIIKNVCKIAKINKKVLIERFAGLKFERKFYEKYELVSSHTARRTFATNAYLAGIPVARIMLLTGHKTEKAFFSYIKIDKKENAKILSKHSFFSRIK